MFILERIISTVAPFRCYLCQREGSVLCTSCVANYPQYFPYCYGCGQANLSSQVCQKCRDRSPLQHVWVRLKFENIAKKLVYDYKFGRRQAAASTIARMMAQGLPYLPRDTLVVSVPTATSRQRQRGYDHAALLGRRLAEQLKLHYLPTLVRLDQSRQVGADRLTRRSQLLSTHRVTGAGLIVDARILLVDDIVTTGASLETTARVLKSAGAAHIDAAVFAQKQ